MVRLHFWHIRHSQHEPDVNPPVLLFQCLRILFRTRCLHLLAHEIQNFHEQSYKRIRITRKFQRCLRATPRRSLLSLHWQSNVLSSDNWKPFYAAGVSSDTVFIVEPFQQLYRVIFWKCQIHVAEIPNLGYKIQLGRFLGLKSVIIGNITRYFLFIFVKFLLNQPVKWLGTICGWGTRSE